MIYTKGDPVQLPNLDLLTFLFDSPHTRAYEDTPVFAEARDPTNAITKAQARSITKSFAHFLRTDYGIGAQGPGKDVVVSISTGQRALPIAFYGVIAAGGVYSAASSASIAKDLVRQLKDGPGKVLICSKDLTKLATEAAKEVGLPLGNILVLESYPHVKLQSLDGTRTCDFSKSLDWERITDPKKLEDGTICILYSSGTTGLPKGVLMSHTNMVSEAYIPAAVCRPIWDEWKSQGKGFDLRSLAHLPTAHIAGVQLYFVNYMYDGGLLYWMPGFAFDDFVKYLDQLKVTTLMTVPPIYMMLAKHPAVTTQLMHLRVAVTGAAPLSAALQQAVSDKMAEGTVVTQVWGLSETTGAVTTTPPGRVDTIGSLSPLLPNVEMRLVDDDGNDVKEGQPGEALIRAPFVTKGYHNNPEANKSSFTPDGWFRTGDVLKIEGDLLYIIDRKKELIKYKGLQVAPAELEGLLASNPAVADAAVIPMPRDDTELPRAYVVLAPAAVGKVSAADLVEFVRTRVSDYKRLRGGVKFLDVLPRSPSGKILRKDLKELLKREMAGSKL